MADAKKLWPLIVFEVLSVLVVVRANLSDEETYLKSQPLVESSFEPWIEWSSGYCANDKNNDIKKVFIRRCSLSKFLLEDPEDLSVCGPEDERFRSEPADRSCRSNRCVLVSTVCAISGVVLVLLTLGIIVYFYNRNPNTDRKLLSENIYDEAVYDVRPATNHHDEAQRLPDIKGARESIELIENDLYDMDIPSPRTPTDRKSGIYQEGDYNIYENVR